MSKRFSKTIMWREALPTRTVQRRPHPRHHDPGPAGNLWTYAATGVFAFFRASANVRHRFPAPAGAFIVSGSPYRFPATTAPLVPDRKYSGVIEALNPTRRVRDGGQPGRNTPNSARSQQRMVYSFSRVSRYNFGSIPALNGGIMSRFISLLTTLAIAALVGREARAGEVDAVLLASLIDRSIESRLAVENLRPADPADDAEFLRRVYLDLHGVIPTAEQATHFRSDTDSKKRDKTIDALLASPRYGEYLADVWQGYLISPLADDARVRADRLRPWLADRFNTETWDRFATQLLTATGKIEQNPAVVYLIDGRLPRTVPDLTDLATRYFLGVRLNCAQCHDHPVVKWTQRDYWGVAAFFTQIQTPGKPKQVYQVGIKDDPAITLATLKDAAPPDGFLSRPPTFLGGEELKVGKGIPNRAAFAAWLTAADNPYFARAMVNRTWWRLFGRGLVNPVDDMHAGNPASHPELLDLLAKRFTDSGFDLKLLTRAMVSTRAYQRTSRPGGTGEKQAALFGRMSVKVLSAGQLYDSLVTAFGPPAKVPGIDSRNPRDEFTKFFADDTAPDSTAYRRGIPHQLRLMNSKQFAGRNVDALVTRLAPAGRVTADAVVAELYLTILSRRPTAEEVRVVHEHAAGAESPAVVYRDLAWALMLSSEFSLNR
jgi:Protein of unknown function (DUF1549)/Protein of unknown function (DUF1553)